jgi:acetylornithine deacetylase/succinyl-diaminopimelate desuccinylase-like protein
MMATDPDAELLARLRSALDRDSSTALLARAVGAASVTGAEDAMVAMLRPEMERLGLEPVVEPFADNRANIRGSRAGAGEAAHLLFMGHIDVVHARSWAARWAGQPQEDPFGAAVIDGELWGRGAADLKAGICAGLAALDLLDRAGIRLGGRVSFAFVGDEESGEPRTGVSAGARDYANRVVAGSIARPDFAIYVEPTRLNVFPVQIGFFIADLVLTGASAYFGCAELGRDALKAAHRVLAAIWEHSDAVAASAEHPLLGRPFVLVTGIDAGGLIAVPGECRLSLIRKLLPGETLDAAVAEFEEAVRPAVADGIEMSVAYPAGRDHPLGGSPAGVDPAHPDVQRLSACLAAVRPGAGAIEGAPFWSEMPFLTEKLGCPAVYCAPGDISICHTDFERVPLADYHDAILAFAAFIAAYCGTVAEDGPEPGRST